MTSACTAEVVRTGTTEVVTTLTWLEHKLGTLGKAANTADATDNDRLSVLQRLLVAE